MSSNQGIAVSDQEIMISGVAFPCSILHPDQSCEINVIEGLPPMLKHYAKLYFPVHAIPFLLYKLKQLRKNPLNTIRLTLTSYAKSIAFLALMVQGERYLWCKQKNIRKIISPTIPIWGGFISGFALLLESNTRAMEITLSIIPRFFETVLNLLASRSFVKKMPKGDALVFACVLAILHYHYQREVSIQIYIAKSHEGNLQEHHQQILGCELIVIYLQIMIKILRSRTKDYIKEGITRENIQLPWAFEGMTPPKDGQMKCFYEWRRIVSEEKLIQMMDQYFKLLNNQQIGKMERIVEHSLKSRLMREVARFEAQKHVLNFSLQCSDFQIHAIENIYRVDVHKGRNRNRVLDLASFQMELNEAPVTAIFKKRPSIDARATLAITFDVSFKTEGVALIKDHNGDDLIKSEGEQTHTLKLESDVLTCDYKSVKKDQINFKDMKRSDTNLHIIDIDQFMNGNSYLHQF